MEEFIGKEGRELMRRFLQGHLDERSPEMVIEPVIGKDGKARTHQRLQGRGIETIFGTGRLRRQGYGGRGMESLHPLDGELNLPPEQCSHTIRRRVAEATAQQSYDEVVNRVRTETGAKVSKRQVEELAERAAQDFEAFYEREREGDDEEDKASGELLIISVDGKGVPMRK